LFFEKKDIFRFAKNENNTPNLRRALLFNSQNKCNKNVGIKFEIIKQYKQDDIKYKLTDLKQRDSWWQMLFTAALTNARQKITGFFRGLYGILF
jgi:hypothetical protein